MYKFVFAMQIDEITYAIVQWMTVQWMIKIPVCPWMCSELSSRSVYGPKCLEYILVQNLAMNLNYHSQLYQLQNSLNDINEAYGLSRI